MEYIAAAAIADFDGFRSSVCCLLRTVLTVLDFEEFRGDTHFPSNSLSMHASDSFFSVRCVGICIIW